MCFARNFNLTLQRNLSRSKCRVAIQNRKVQAMHITKKVQLQDAVFNIWPIVLL